MLIFKLVNDEDRTMRFLSGEVVSKKIARQCVRETGRSVTVVRVDLPGRKESVLTALNSLIDPDNTRDVEEIECLSEIEEEGQGSFSESPIVRFDAGDFKADVKRYAVKYPVKLS